MAAFDHLIIGSGINALVAAAMLSRKGDSVLVVEREDRVGGCMYTSDAVTLPGFHHDVMAATFVLFLTSPAYAGLAEDLAEHGLAFCHSAHPTAALRPDGSNLVLGMDRAANVAAFNACGAGDGDQHAADVGAIEADADFLFALLGQPLWSRQALMLLAKQAWKKGLGPLKTWFGEALEPSRGWLETRYASADVQALWAAWVLHVGLTPEATYGGQMSRVIAFALEAAGAPVVKGGAGQAAAAFRSLIEAKGGVVRTGVEATKIIVEKGRAIGIETAQEEKILAKNIIASTAPGQLYDGLLAGQSQPETTKKYRHGRGNFQLHYALDGAVEWQSAGLEDVALIHLTDGIDAVSKSSNEAERGMLPAVPTICVGQPNRLDPGRCPEGKAILWLQIPDAPSAIKGDAAGQIETVPDWTEEMREAFADRIEGILSRHIKNWDRIKLKRRAYSPRDLEQMNVNLVGGDPYGGACTLDQFFVWRPVAGQVNNGTSVKNLYHIGASTHPGPGLGGGSGLNVAKGLGA
ncbi:NAD(P)/FAD-dependent oxidoreductase [Sulfitobacter sp. M57]|uniref:phytoene desaturase family protein n=1 Tax=unclassified Sulfitobacter TaxID=196795 RepID=UPI0023E1016D|nr:MULTISPECIES: NAD(P)/FAD-dependent oxidoreductase [unclassified Sulfitobacter]MDF3416038.1 NAD(P)/FAD-dependent oxidoreductase [Sulfitobacter sp. KE5]MDF3423518.1 NAD(P)/FAD-dependent oxidoreductase [Sulfitobacter sp. KE43]MDF3434681.1 NAD(P)/FAD-dependent oxidoreductase [Sulfitobacter sp. KE42]MDF3460224.1 NAD(P)/FAD-dependent oxidoreductase [Sulfitobacter sp. S74]MDF3464218.1 NAD(P)/FAD-dependent oxidoreductase [Sulfitobacter sp. Ks18]